MGKSDKQKDKRRHNESKHDSLPTGDLRNIIRKLNEQIKSQDLIVHNVPGDGNCLFHAIQRHIAEDIDPRHIACQYMEDNEADFSPFVDTDEFETFQDYLSAMRRDKEWGGDLEIRALACALRCVIVVHILDRTPLLISCDGTPRHVAHLAFLNDDHYGCVEYASPQARDAWFAKFCTPPAKKAAAKTSGKPKKYYSHDDDDDDASSSTSNSDEEEDVTFKMDSLRLTDNTDTTSSSKKKLTCKEAKALARREKKEKKTSSKKKSGTRSEDATERPKKLVVGEVVTL